MIGDQRNLVGIMNGDQRNLVGIMNGDQRNLVGTACQLMVISVTW